MFLKISENLHENTCAGVSLSIKLQAEGYIDRYVVCNLKSPILSEKKSRNCFILSTEYLLIQNVGLFL